MSHDSPELPSDLSPNDHSPYDHSPHHPPSYDHSPHHRPSYERPLYDRPSPAWSTGQDEPPGARPPDAHSGAHRTLRLLRRAYRWQRRVATFTALGYFAAFLTLTVKAPSLMAHPGPGGLPTGLVLGLVQIPVTWLAVLLYEVTAHRFVDPLARHARRQTRVAVADRERTP
ncbi:DUF485 domain-containing protein [Streptomyces sp. NPDC002677]|uniref:DUF485 domain-containing protein n=1 Tax=Streptomyces sp. NPDC002677 TaxID=3154774 RepID=UPI003321351E